MKKKDNTKKGDYRFLETGKKTLKTFGDKGVNGLRKVGGGIKDAKTLYQATIRLIEKLNNLGHHRC